MNSTVAGSLGERLRFLKRFDIMHYGAHDSIAVPVPRVDGTLSRELQQVCASDARNGSCPTACVVRHCWFREEREGMRPLVRHNVQ